MQFSRLNPITAGFVLLALAAFAIMVWKRVPPEEMAAVGGVIVGIAAQLDRLFRAAPDERNLPPPPGATLFPFVVCVGLVSLTSCSGPTRAAAAEAEYTHEKLRCVEAEPSLGPDAGLEARRAAWDRVDACTTRVEQRWGIVTFTGKDGGR